MDAARRWMDIINHGSEWEEEGEGEQDEDTKQNSSPPPTHPPTLHRPCLDPSLYCCSPLSGTVLGEAKWEKSR